jgi:leucyl aminopeptidase
MSFKFKAFAMFAVLFCIAGGILFFVGNSQAEKVTHWVTVDQNELAHIQTALARTGDADLSSVEVQFVQNGIAALRLEDVQMEKLSSAMHDNFHKCAGFVAHESREAAVDWIQREAAVDPNQQFVDYTIDNQANVTQLLPVAAEANIRQTILDLSAFQNRCYNQTTGINSATLIKDRWTALAAGRSDVTVEFYNHPTATSPQPSIILTIQGTTLPNEIVVLGGHQDSINGTCSSATIAPGADDDASGIASLTEAIRVLMTKNFKPRRTVKFMAYAAEEVGLRGSAAIAQSYRTQNINVVGVMQLDMTNYKSPISPAFDIVMITDRTNAAQNTFVTNLVSTYQPGLSVGTSTCGYGCSDHSSWNAQNYPASFPFEATLATDNPTIHTVNDTINQSSGNANHALKFSRLALSFVGELAKGELAAARKGVIDFDGDSKTDLSIYRPTAAEWWINRSSNNSTVAAQFGSAAGLDEPVPADYTGDGKTDIAFFRPSTGEWFMLRSENGSFLSFPFGAAGDVATVADFDADGKADPVIFRPASGEWFILKSTGGTTIVTFGTVNDKPVPADFDGDGKADVAIFRPSDGSWWYVRSTDNQFRVSTFGATGDRPVQGDWTGDGKADIAVWRELTGEWFVQRSEDNSYYSNTFGTVGDIAAPGDYDGDGRFDLAIFRPADANWYVQRSTAGLMIQQFGATGDTPLPAFRNY